MKKCWITFGGELRTGGLRILNNLKKYAPDNLIFVDNYEEADFIVMHHQYKHDLDWFMENCKKPFIFLISELQQSFQYFEDFFSNDYLKMTYTFHPLEYLGYTNKHGKHIHAPWGVDTNVFNISPEEAVKAQKDNTIIAFSYYDSENYNQIYQSCRLINGKMLHLDIKKWDFLRQGLFFDPRWHWYTSEFVPDEELVKMYQSCNFVSGLRSGNGYEVPVLEGLLCGARPICFDNIYYTQWFKDFAVFIPEKLNCDMTDSLVKVFNNYDKHKVSVDEIKYVRDKFGWPTIAKNFWKEVNRSIGGF